DSISIVNYSDKIILKINVDTKTDEYFYKNNEENTRLHIKPNNRYRMFLSLDYEFIGVSVGFVPKFLGANHDEDLKGASSFTDYQFRFFLGRWVQGMSFGKITGYYVQNTNDYFPNWTEGIDPYIQFNNLYSKTYGMSTSYVFNPDFSYRNIVYQNEWQKQSSGSIIGSLFYDYNIFDLGEADGINRDKFFNIRLSPSYYYTYVLHQNWFLSGNLSPSLGLRFSKSESGTDGIITVENNTYITRQLAAGLNLGFSSEKVIYGLNINFSADWYNEDDASRTENDKFYGLVYFGYRFDSPRPVAKLFHPKKKDN
ncbi:MAG: DUF4421 family protein, partial [Bacteroidota bacterium]|nr:DUF4421 family protein [Bacteroidota bacterium]